MKIRPVGAEMLHADGQTDMKKLKAACRNFTNASKHAGSLNIQGKKSIKLVVVQKYGFWSKHFFFSYNYLLFPVVSNTVH